MKRYFSTASCYPPVIILNKTDYYLLQNQQINLQLWVFIVTLKYFEQFDVF
ncbi:hypothetical protein EHW99_2144 [Erwinia amylovora]|uniref:Uncharacterized protein n=3 Tax=Erwinia amylovora TaxID=552 RepID=A0A830ZY76_ERWAM|nr:hypothetical protein EaACW_1443 [Erwinia amylovora ACW56400]QJQ54846.1 hypothetical protein EHX00_2144 [Erwinia amylovora]CBA20387.1 hypothetical protein predicted by Glimmer/Critica [Erwinia amylovora CFBP1430]CBX80296.1 hypothetical protein predicted by Glimmer/Critica [Erwinia amylovora ATCC BAA-2158]CCO78291.1 hypothetical protein BN432_1487 [Erwinia amylovora Ea356]CCO82080.1 hypothetical protein BN433_1502 [Erwinia amylovora Ea266]CCO85876.1 hypothetical protein BN434_1482 [Erwinia a